MRKSACELLLQKISCFFPVWNVDDLSTARYYYKRSKSTDAIVAKIFFYQIWIYREHVVKRWQVAINTWQPLEHDWIRHLSCTGLNVCRYKMKEIFIFKCMETCYRYVIYTVLRFFLSNRRTLANDKTSWEYRSKDEKSSLVTFTYLFYLYTIPPHHPQ